MDTPSQSSAHAASHTGPVLPPSAPRPAARFERRSVDLTMPERAPHRHTSLRAYLIGALALAAVSIAGWFVLGEYIYG